MTLQIDNLSRLEARASSASALSDLRSQSTYRVTFKRVFDVCLAVLAMPIVLPVIAVLALLIALDGHNPFYVQRRVGKGARIFGMIKLRSMVPNADQKLRAYLESDSAAREEWDRDQKLKHDPRVTRLGRVIRATSLDELPQFLNVLTGDMSLVGPRPMMTDQMHIYPGDAYYQMRPGVTGLWQVSDRNETTFAERAVYDLRYFMDLSVWLDIRILARTVLVVFRGTGC